MLPMLASCSNESLEHWPVHFEYQAGLCCPAALFHLSCICCTTRAAYGLTLYFVWLQRTQICYGSLGEVRRFEEFMLGKSERFADAAVKA